MPGGGSMQVSFVKSLVFGLALGVTLLFSLEGKAAPGASPTSPSRAVVKNSGAMLTVEEDLAVETKDGFSRISFLLPHGAHNLSFRIPKATIVSWEQHKERYLRTSAAFKDRALLDERRKEIDMRLNILEQRQKVWQIESEAFTYKDIEALDARIESLLPALLKEKNDLKEEKKRLEETVKDLGALELTGSRVTILLEETPETALRVFYSYSLSHCGWKPKYAFSIDPQKNNSDVKVRFLAELWQNTGIDWKNTEIVLVSGNIPSERREPSAVPSWVISADEDKFEASMENAVQPARMQAAGALAGRTRMAPPALKAYREPRADTSGIFARWTLPVRSLNEGRIELLVQEETWKAPITWLARPTRNKGEVFLLVHTKIEKNTVYPDGEASYMVSGQEVGQGRFSVKSGEVDLFFGKDPRVSFEVVQDRKRGESGFLGRDRTWSWAWKYIVKNSHDRTIKVRIERPMPRIVDEKIAVVFQDVPKPVHDKNKHLVIWEVEIPAHGEKDVQHAVRISAPEKMPLHPVAP